MGQFTYYLEARGAVITSYTGTEKSIAIPETIDGHTVVAIGGEFSIFSREPATCGLVHVELPKTVTDILKRAFCGMHDLETVDIPDSVCCIGADAFANSGITSISIPRTVKYIGDHAFRDCSRLKSVYCGGEVYSEGYWAFSKCTALEDITLHDTATRDCFGSRAFEQVDKPVTIHYRGTTVTMKPTDDFRSLIEHQGGDKPVEGGNVYEQYEYVEDTTGVTINKYTGKDEKVVIPDTINGKPVNNIGRASFTDNEALKEVTMPDSVRHIGIAAFAGCRNLHTISLSKNLVCIDDWAFDDCEKLTDFSLPEGLAFLGINVFGGCKSIKEFTLPISLSYVKDLSLVGDEDTTVKYNGDLILREDIEDLKTVINYANKQPRPTNATGKYTIDELMCDAQTLMKVLQKHDDWEKWFKTKFPKGAESAKEVLEALNAPPDKITPLMEGYVMPDIYRRALVQAGVFHTMGQLTTLQSAMNRVKIPDTDPNYEAQVIEKIPEVVKRFGVPPV